MVLKALEKSKNMTDGAMRPLQVSVGSVEHVGDGIIHTDVFLVCKLQGVQGVAHKGLEVLQNQSLKDLHDV